MAAVYPHSAASKGLHSQARLVPQGVSAAQCGGYVMQLGRPHPISAGPPPYAWPSPAAFRTPVAHRTKGQILQPPATTATSSAVPCKIGDVVGIPEARPAKKCPSEEGTPRGSAVSVIGESASTATPADTPRLNITASLDSEEGCSELDVRWEAPAEIAELQAGSYSKAGRKTNIVGWQNQDSNLVLHLGKGRVLVAVFDGHGQWGHIVSNRAREVFTCNANFVFTRAPDELSVATMEAGLRTLFRMADDAICAEIDHTSGRALAEFSGTTATAAVIDYNRGHMTVAHVGDSALIVTSGQTVLYRTADHVVDEAAEQRIIACGGEARAFTISGITAKRVCKRGSDFPGLAMARALGDLVARSLGVSPEPEVHAGVPLPIGSSVVVASDGVWEHVPPENVAASIIGTDAAADAARAVVDLARSQWPKSGNIDDITAVVVAGCPRKSTSVAPAETACQQRVV